MSFRECIQTDEIPVKMGCRDFISGQNFLAQKFTIIFFAVSLELTLIIFIVICLFQYEKQRENQSLKMDTIRAKMFSKCVRIQTNRNSINVTV